MSERSSKDRTPATAGSVVSFSSESGARRRAPVRELRIPELYRRPMGDRELQGCLKARA